MKYEREYLIGNRGNSVVAESPYVALKKNYGVNPFPLREEQPIRLPDGRVVSQWSAEVPDQGRIYIREA